jgi:uncharacterized small protein (DUF1192 family)
VREALGALRAEIARTHAEEPNPAR